MAKNLRWKILVILGVVALSVFAFYPPDQKVQLGLDLKGGVQLVMRVQTEDAVRIETETTADRLREQLRTANMSAATVTIVSPTEFRVEGVASDQEQAFRALVADIETSYNRTSAAGTYTFSLRPNIANQLREDSVNQALQTIDRRVNELGVTEPVIARHTEDDQILVQLPGVTDVARAKEIIK
jgi:preprotein translocase subunit SecD